MVSIRTDIEFQHSMSIAATSAMPRIVSMSMALAKFLRLVLVPMNAITTVIIHPITGIHIKTSQPKYPSTLMEARGLFFCGGSKLGCISCTGGPYATWEIGWVWF